MKNSDLRLGFLGFGHMAQIIFRALDRAKFLPRSHVYFLRRDPAKMKKNEQEFGITSTSLKTLVEKSHVLFLAVRPQQVGPLLRDFVRLDLQGKLFISLLAGVNISFFHQHLGPELSVVRALPNLAAAVGEGMTALSYAPQVGLEFRSFSRLLFSSFGEVVEIPEPLMDLVCGMAGSGPGFVLRLIEAAARLGEREGLSYETSLKIAAQTFAGAARLLLKGALPEELLLQIATPGGTTEAGIRVMRESSIEKHFQEAILAAARRAKELAG